VLAALALGLSAPGAAAQVPGVELPVDPAAVEIPHDTAISEQYRAVEEAVAEAVPEVPEVPAQPAPAPEPAPEAAPPAPAPQQYHSETSREVTVTQDQPTNVNVSIRINSPGDDGPVVQIHNAGGTGVVDQVVEADHGAPRGAPVPDPAGSQPSGLPDDWEWVWTSACFGGAPRAAAAGPSWRWRWSCDQRDEDLDRGLADFVPDAWALVNEVLASTPEPGFGPSIPAASRSEPDARAERRARRRAPAAVAPAAPAARSGSPPLARPLIAATAGVPAAVAGQVRDVVRTAARARPGTGDPSGLVPPPLGGPAAVGSSALGAAASLLLGLWIAVLTTAIVLVVPRLRRRRRSGPAPRRTRLASSRLERPG
jgi:hypothetical protein